MSETSRVNETSSADLIRTRSRKQGFIRTSFIKLREQCGDDQRGKSKAVILRIKGIYKVRCRSNNDDNKISYIKWTESAILNQQISRQKSVRRIELKEIGPRQIKCEESCSLKAF